MPLRLVRVAGRVGMYPTLTVWL